MTIQERAIDSAVILDLGGRLALGDGDGLLKERVQQLLGSGSRFIVLNLADVSYVDSAGLGALVAVFLDAKKSGGSLKLLNPSKRLHDLLTMARLLTVLEISGSEAEALASFNISV